MLPITQGLGYHANFAITFHCGFNFVSFCPCGFYPTYPQVLGALTIQQGKAINCLINSYFIVKGIGQNVRKWGISHTLIWTIIYQLFLGLNCLYFKPISSNTLSTFFNTRYHYGCSGCLMWVSKQLLTFMKTTTRSNGKKK